MCQNVFCLLHIGAALSYFPSNTKNAMKYFLSIVVLFLKLYSGVLYSGVSLFFLIKGIHFQYLYLGHHLSFPVLF